MDVIVETDIGHDPDDFFALCYLIAAGVKVRGVLVVPGDPDQIAVVRFLCSRVGLDIPIGASKLNRVKRSSGGVHHWLLSRYGHPLDSAPDGYGPDVFEAVIDQHPAAELFVIGPVTSVGASLSRRPTPIARATMQGGFLGYHQHSFPCRRIQEWEGRSWMPTFNLNGDRRGAESFCSAPVRERLFVGKHVCHTVVYDAGVYRKMEKPRNVAAELFMEGMGEYLQRHESKKFHDPTAAVCMLHPEIASWVRGKVVKIEGGWGTVLQEDGDWVIAGIDYEALWGHIQNWN
jgi:inosine-uridine nucleoside N-ribohydrolase